MAKKCVVCDCNYNVMKQLVKLNQVLWNIDKYIKDAKKSKHKECVKAFTTLRKDCIKNATNLKKLVVMKAKKGKL
tara:strand:+ start:232 stop:456 length:225 start_codon:yes stop_codon:yes gene_type:complete